MTTSPGAPTVPYPPRDTVEASVTITIDDLEFDPQAPAPANPSWTASTEARYERVSTLGEGGTAVVELVHDRAIGRAVALKRLRPESQCETGMRRFTEEVRTVARLQHPNIPQIHDVGVDEHGHPYFVMQRIDGETLREVIARLAAGDPETHARFDFAARARIVLDILGALELAHSQGLIHRDLKPSNIMVGPRREVTVMDWGLVRSTDEAEAPTRRGDERSEAHADGRRTTDGTIVGTPMYMTPEQVTGERDLDGRTDLYALAVTFYELMTLHHPLEGKETIEDVLLGILTEDATFATFARHPHQPAVPVEYGHLLRRGMCKEPECRFQSAQEMRRALEVAMGKLVCPQCPTSLIKYGLGRLAEVVDARPLLSLTVVGLLPIAVGVVGWLAIEGARSLL